MATDLNRECDPGVRQHSRDHGQYNHMNKSPVASMRHYLANSRDTQAISEGDALGSQAERRERFAALRLAIPGLITAAELQRKIASHPDRLRAPKETEIANTPQNQF